MRYREEVRDLFSVPEEYGLVHCISADFAMGKGIVVEFNRRFDMKRRLQRGYPLTPCGPPWSGCGRSVGMRGFCILPCP